MPPIEDFEDLDAELAAAFDDAVDGKPLNDEVVQPDSPLSGEAQNLEDGDDDVVASVESSDGTPPISDDEDAASPVADSVDSELASELEAAKRRNDELQDKLNEQAAAPAQEESFEEPEQVDIEFTEEEQATLAQVEEDWPEVMQAMTLKHDLLVKRVAALLDIQFNQLQVKLAPYLRKIESQETETAWHGVAGSDPVATLKDNVQGWVEKQPRLVQAAYQSAIDSGEADKIAEVVDAYRGSNPVKAAGEVNAVNKKDNDRVSRMRPVQSRRSGHVAEADPNDENSAWQEAISGT